MFKKNLKNVTQAGFRKNLKCGRRGSQKSADRPPFFFTGTALILPALQEPHYTMKWQTSPRLQTMPHRKPLYKTDSDCSDGACLDRFNAFTLKQYWSEGGPEGGHNN